MFSRSARNDLDSILRDDLLLLSFPFLPKKFLQNFFGQFVTSFPSLLQSKEKKAKLGRFAPYSRKREIKHARASRANRRESTRISSLLLFIPKLPFFFLSLSLSFKKFLRFFKKERNEKKKKEAKS